MGTLIVPGKVGGKRREEEREGTKKRMSADRKTKEHKVESPDLKVSSKKKFHSKIVAVTQAKVFVRQRDYFFYWRRKK